MVIIVVIVLNYKIILVHVIMKCHAVTVSANEVWLHVAQSSLPLTSTLSSHLPSKVVRLLLFTCRACLKKTIHLTFDCNFGKCTLIYKILSPSGSSGNFVPKYHKDSPPYLKCFYSTYYIVTYEN